MLPVFFLAELTQKKVGTFGDVYSLREGTQMFDPLGTLCRVDMYIGGTYIGNGNRVGTYFYFVFITSRDRRTYLIHFFALPTAHRCRATIACRNSQVHNISRITV